MSCDKFIMLEDNNDNFQTWQGLIGPHYTPHVTSEGLLYWTNNGRLSNPSAVNIKGPAGQGLQIIGIADTVESLPETQPAGSVWLVGVESPYDSYVFFGEWVYLGTLEVGPPGPQGPQGPQGDPGENYILTENDKSEIADIVIADTGIGTEELETESHTVKGSINELHDGKVDKVDGKGLSTNDYDNTEKSKLGTAAEDILALTEKVGDAELETTNKNLSAAVNELKQNVDAVSEIAGDGQLSGFTATDLTGGLNELMSSVEDLQDIAGDGQLDSGFTATDLTGAANELKTSINNKKDKQTAVSDPTASGTSATFIDTISQNAQGVITPTKKTVRTMGAASASASGTTGLVPAPAAGKQASFLRGDGTWVVPTNTTYSAGTGLSLSGTTFNVSTVPIANGGTNASTAANARTNLGLGGAATKSVANNVTTSSSGSSVLDAYQGKVLWDRFVIETQTKTSTANNEYLDITNKSGYSPVAIMLTTWNADLKPIAGWAWTGATWTVFFTKAFAKAVSVPLKVVWIKN